MTYLSHNDKNSPKAQAKYAKLKSVSRKTAKNEISILKRDKSDTTQNRRFFAALRKKGVFFLQNFFKNKKHFVKKYFFFSVPPPPGTEPFRSPKNLLKMGHFSLIELYFIL